MKKLFFLITILALEGCSEPFQYKYQKQEQTIECTNINTKLIHEALYSFKDDISRYYLKEIKEKDYLNFSYSYSQYIYSGAKGELNYKEIASPHTIKVFDKLVKEGDLFIKIKGKSNLNYKNDFVKCLIDNIKSEDIRTKIINLIDVNYLSPEVMAENYRVSNYDAEIDPYYLLFIALDTYYQHFLDINFSKTN